MKNWIKGVLGITALEDNLRIEREIASARDDMHKKQLDYVTQLVSNKSNDIDETLQELHQLTVVDADVGIRGNNTIIMTGVLRGKAFVKFYDLPEGEFKGMVEQLNHLQKHCYIRNVDAPMCNFKGSFLL